jgi:ABC-type polysaccharide/polyol phosphate export permease
MPLIQTAVMVLVFQYGAITVNKEGTYGMPYVLFVLAGVLPWTLFNGTIASSMECLTRNSRLVTKIYFPREVFPLANVAGGWSILRSRWGSWRRFTSGLLRETRT